MKKSVTVALLLAGALTITGCTNASEKKETKHEKTEVAESKTPFDSLTTSEQKAIHELKENEILPYMLTRLAEGDVTKAEALFQHAWKKNEKTLYESLTSSFELIPVEGEEAVLVRFEDETKPFRFKATLQKTGERTTIASFREVEKDAFVAKPIKEVKAKGLYLSGHSVELTERFQHTLDLLDETDLNALVIDVKEDDGYVTYDSMVSVADTYQTDERTFIRDIRSKMEELKKRDVYTIARIVTFKDPLLATKNPEWAMKRASDGAVWKDSSGVSWIDPYNKSFWEYPIALAKEAARLGFDEIQFDYVRFPALTETQHAQIAFQNPDGVSREDNIANFLTQAKEELAPYGVKVSADVFGLVTSMEDDMGIGQMWEKLSPVVDVLSPMTYPSHYGVGSYGFTYPDAQPYGVIKKAMSDALERQKTLEAEGKSTATIRPWFQDFTAPWVPGHIAYGANEVNAQIRAAKELGIEEYLMWDAHNTYTESAWK